MRKYLLVVLLSISILIFPLAYSVFAADASLGVSTWYAWWEFHDNDDMKVDPTLTFGPVFSLRFSESWSIAGVFLYGKFKNNQEGSGGGSSHIERYDSDLSLNYNIGRYFKIFIGGKYMQFSWDETNGSGRHWSTGPGLGMGSTVPLTEFLYLLLNVSGTYSLGDHNSPSQKSKLNEASLNSNISFAFYIRPASTSINFGFRYQYVKTDYKNTDTILKDESFSFFGPTLSVVYSF